MRIIAFGHQLSRSESSFLVEGFVGMKARVINFTTVYLFDRLGFQRETFN